MPEIIELGGGGTADRDDVDRRDHELLALLARDAAAPRVEILADLRRAHPIVRRGAKALERMPYTGLENPPRPPAANIMAVPKSQTQRAKLFLEALFRAIENRGLGIPQEPTENGPTPCLMVLGVRMDLRLDHHRVRLRHPDRLRPAPAADDDTEAERDLVLSVWVPHRKGRRRWGGLGGRRIETWVNEIPPALIAMAAAERETPPRAGLDR